jgi:hypothetical protein
MTIVRFAVWLGSVGWLSYGASAFSNGNALGSWISVCCFGAGVLVDALLTTDDASPAGDDMALSSFGRGRRISRIEHGRARRAGGRERRPHSPLLREQGNQE